MNVKKQIIQPDTVAKPGGVWSPAVAVYPQGGRIVFVSGFTSRDTSGADRPYPQTNDRIHSGERSAYAHSSPNGCSNHAIKVDLRKRLRNNASHKDGEK